MVRWPSRHNTPLEKDKTKQVNIRPSTMKKPISYYKYIIAKAIVFLIDIFLSQRIEVTVELQQDIVSTKADYTLGIRYFMM